MDNLKKYKSKELQYFIFANSLIIILFSVNINTKTFKNNYDFIFEILTFLGNMGIIYIYSIILDSLIPTKVKNYLVFGSIKKLSGNLAFTKLFNKGHSDYRVSTTALRNFYRKDWENIKLNSQEPLCENKTWYLLYSQVKEEQMIFHSNSNYLLTRDMSIVALFFFIGYFFTPILPYVYYNYKVHLYFVLLWCTTIYSAHKTGEKFANNVLIINYLLKKEKTNL